jgi:hypothetical protein
VIGLHDAPPTPEGALPMWVIYDHPTDFPHLFVARLWHCGGGEPDPVPTGMAIGSPELDGLRKMFIEAGMYCLTRNDGDEAQIVETWM